MRVLLVEDDGLLGDGLAAGLREAGFVVDWVRDGLAAEAALVLDLGLPRRDGLTVLANLRQSGSPVPVLVLTARDQVADKVRALDLGADDYVVKPFDLDEIAARLRALVRRAHGRPQPVLEHGPLRLDPAGRSLTLDGENVSVTPREFDILQLRKKLGEGLIRTVRGVGYMVDKP